MSSRFTVQCNKLFFNSFDDTLDKIVAQSEFDEKEMKVIMKLYMTKEKVMLKKKRKMSAYNLFKLDKSPLIKDDFPDFKDLNKELARLWNEVSPKIKAKYEKLAQDALEAN